MEATVDLARLFDTPEEGALSLFNCVAGIDVSSGARITAAISSFLEPIVARIKCAVGADRTDLFPGADGAPVCPRADSFRGECSYVGTGKRVASGQNFMCAASFGGGSGSKKF